MCHVHRTARRRARPSLTGVPRGRNVTGLLCGARLCSGAAVWRHAGAALCVGRRRDAPLRPSEAGWRPRACLLAGSEGSRHVETSSRWASRTDTVARVAAPKLAVLLDREGRQPAVGKSNVRLTPGTEWSPWSLRTCRFRQLPYVAILPGNV